jgi:hypothetical protein
MSSWLEYPEQDRAYLQANQAATDALKKGELTSSRS